VGRIQRTNYRKQHTLDGGVDQYHEPIELKDNKLQEASDIFIDANDVFKRPGKQRWGGASTLEYTDGFNGVHEFIDEDGTQRILAASGTDLFQVTSTTKNSLDTITDEDIHFHTLKGRCFYNGAVTQGKLIKDVSSDVGLDNPTTAPTTAVGAAGALTGSYAVKVTYVIEVGGVRTYESNPPDADSNSTTLAAQQLNLSSVPVSPDARVTHRYIYRTTAGGSKYYYDGKIADNTTTTYTTNVIDAILGDEVEYTHGQPVHGDVSVGCSERQFWISGNKLYYSELAQFVEYLEYSNSLNFITMPNNGLCVGLKSLYNQNTGKEDLYIFQEDAISILPNGDPNVAIYTSINYLGLLQQDSIVEYNGWLVFLTQKQSMGMVKGGQFVDISSRNIPVSITEAFNKEEARGALIFDHYYAITTQNDSGKLYNTQTWVCDLRKIVEVQNGMADAVWFPWELNAKYLLQLKDGTVLMFGSNDGYIYTLSLADKYDEDGAGAVTEIEASLRTKNFDGSNIITLKQPRVLALTGKFESQIEVRPYSYKEQSNALMNYNTLDAVFIMGLSLMGSRTTNFVKMLEEPIPCATVGNTFSFEITARNRDGYFKLNGIQYTVKEFGRLL
jgi:hypothetical protein